MELKELEKAAKTALEGCRDLGFDLLQITPVDTTVLGIRIAGSSVSRENVFRQNLEVRLTGHYGSRETSLTLPAGPAESIREGAVSLRRQLDSAHPSSEHVLPRPPAGDFRWFPGRKSFAEVYTPARLYEALAAPLAKARDQGLRVTGYVEAATMNWIDLVSSGYRLEAGDHGMTVTFTVDQGEDGGPTGSAVRSVTSVNPEGVEEAIATALEEAMASCFASDAPESLEPGDYDVILSPRAVADLLTMTLFYGFTDRRKIEEGRTYLSGRLESMSFPDGLTVAQTVDLPLEGGRYAHVPFDPRGTPIDSMNLIRRGRIEDLHTDPYWAQKTGFQETFAPQNGAPLSIEAKADGTLELHDDVEALIAAADRAVYVTNVWYLRLVAEMEGVLTGMTRDGLFWVEGGEIRSPLTHMRWHDNPLRILSAVTAATRECHTQGRSRMCGPTRTPLSRTPALKVKDFHFSSRTQF